MPGENRGDISMQQRKLVALLTILVVMAVIGMQGCGGGSGGGSGGGAASVITAQGRVQMPAGSKLAVTSLQVLSADGTTPVAANAGFTTPVRSTEPATLFLTDSAGNLIMIGYSSVNGGPGEISARTTAQALLFYATGAQTLPPDQYAQALSMIAASSAATQLTNTVAARIAADPTALSDGDSALVTAVTSAAATLSPPGSRAALQAAPTGTGGMVAHTRVAVVSTGRADAGQLLIQPSGLQSGVEIIQNPNGTGIVASNNFRRHCQFFVYKTGTRNQNGVVTKFTLVQPVGGAHDLPSVVK